MTPSEHTWALILAAGDGRRLSDLTGSGAGRSVPKQFCSLRGGPSLLHEAVARAARVTLPTRISLIVSEAHRAWWQQLDLNVAAEHIVVQPDNRGTAIGILLPLLRLLERDPEADIVLLPSDHHVVDEAVLTTALREALAVTQRSPQHVVLLGMVPDCPDPGLGYIVPAAPDPQGSLGVAEFVEKPPARIARSLIARGALWSPFILAAKGRTLLARIEEYLPAVVAAMRSALGAGATSAGDLAALYERLPTLDFSHHILTAATAATLRVLPVPPCGWSDLGTPERLGLTLARLPLAGEVAGFPAALRAPINLAERYYATQGSQGIRRSGTRA